MVFNAENHASEAVNKAIAVTLNGKLVSKFKAGLVKTQKLKPRMPLPFQKGLKSLDPVCYGRLGNLEVRLASGKKDIKRAQKIRYRVFYKEMSAIPDLTSKMKRRDIDAYDPLCDHLLVVDHGKGKGKDSSLIKKPRVVGTYRLLSQATARQNSGFYSQNEYDLNPLLAAKGRTHKFLEVGRSCVLKTHRNKRTIELLWHGLWTYIRQNKFDVMIGCASFNGIDPREHALALSFLYHNALAPEEWRVRAHDHLHVEMNMLPKDMIDQKRALKTLPPLIKGYLRLGAFFGDGAVIDHQFGTTDVLVVLPVDVINERYLNHFGSADKMVSQIQ